MQCLISSWGPEIILEVIYILTLFQKHTAFATFPNEKAAIKVWFSFFITKVSSNFLLPNLGIKMGSEVELLVI